MISESNKIRFSNTIRVLWLFMVVFLACVYFKFPLDLTILKMLVVPMFWLSTLGINSLYKKPIKEQPTFSSNVIEANALYALVLGIFIIIVIWKPDMPYMKMLTSLATMVCIYVPLSLVAHHRELKRTLS